MSMYIVPVPKILSERNIRSMNIYVAEKEAGFFSFPEFFPPVINDTFVAFGCYIILKHKNFPRNVNNSRFLVSLFCFLFGFLCARTTFIRSAGKQIRHDDR